MNFNEIKELINLVNDSDLAYFEAEYDGKYIKMDKSLSRDNNTLQKGNVDNEKLQFIEDKINVKENNSEEKNKTKDDFESINSPMVGTFYKAISPESQPFVKVGQKVLKGEILCIVEAMKLMNEIVAEFDCEIVSIESENGKMVEYNQPLFKIRR